MCSTTSFSVVDPLALTCNFTIEVNASPNLATIYFISRITTPKPPLILHRKSHAHPSQYQSVSQALSPLHPTSKRGIRFQSMESQFASTPTRQSKALNSIFIHINSLSNILSFPRNRSSKILHSSSSLPNFPSNVAETARHPILPSRLCKCSTGIPSQKNKIKNDSPH